MTQKKPCPLCQKEMFESPHSSPYVSSWHCKEFVEYVYPVMIKQYYHYNESLNVSKSIIMHAPPYKVVTNLETKMSKIYVYVSPDDPVAENIYKTGQESFKKVLETDYIKPDVQEKLYNRIKTLLVFS